MSIREIVNGLRIFERNKVPLEIKILGIDLYSNFFSEKNCKDFIRISSRLEVISTPMDKEV